MAMLGPISFRGDQLFTEDETRPVNIGRTQPQKKLGFSPGFGIHSNRVRVHPQGPNKIEIQVQVQFQCRS